MRDQAKQMGMANWQYNSITRTSLKNSLTLPKSEVSKLVTDHCDQIWRNFAIFAKFNSCWQFFES